MKKIISLILVAIVALVTIVSVNNQYVSVVADPDFGFAVSYRTTTKSKFETLFLWMCFAPSGGEVGGRVNTAGSETRGK